MKFLKLSSAGLFALLALFILFTSIKVFAATHSFNVDTHVNAILSVSGMGDNVSNGTTWSGASTVMPGTSLYVTGYLARSDTGNTIQGGTIDVYNATTTRSQSGTSVRVFSNGSSNPQYITASNINSNQSMILFNISFPCVLSELPGCTGTSKTVSYAIPYYVAPNPIVTVTATPNPVTYGGTTNITWTSSYAVSCKRSDTGASVALNAPTSGFTIGPLYSNTTINIICTNPGV